MRPIWAIYPFSFFFPVEQMLAKYRSKKQAMEDGREMHWNEKAVWLCIRFLGQAGEYSQINPFLSFLEVKSLQAKNIPGKGWYVLACENWHKTLVIFPLSSLSHLFFPDRWSNMLFSNLSLSFTLLQWHLV